MTSPANSQFICMQWMMNALEPFNIKVLDKEEILINWAEIWDATEKIVKHLKASPVFYPGEEFTEKVYKDYFMSNDLELIGAYADGKLVGIIEWNQEENDFLEGKSNSVNVG